MSSRPFARAVSSALAALLAAGVPVVPRAFADDVPRVLVAPIRVVDLQVSPSLAPKVADILADELHGQDAVQLAQPKVEPAPATNAKDDANAAFAGGGAGESLGRIEKGIALVKKLKFKAGAEQIESGLQDYESFPGQVDIKKLRDAYIQLAVGQMRAGDNEAAMQALSDAVRLSPESKLGGNYPPVFTRAYAEAKKKTLAGKRGTISVKGEGTVEVDGKPAGAAPAEVAGLIEGAHFVKVTRSDGSVWGVKVSVAEGDNAVNVPASGVAHPAALAVDAPELAPLESNKLDASVVAGLQRLAKESSAELVLYGVLYKSGDGLGFAPHLYSAKSRTSVALHAAHFDTELVSAGIELDKVASETAKLARAFPRTPETLPGPAASELVKPKVAATEPAKPPDEQPKIVLVTPPPREPEPKRPELTASTHVPAAGGLEESVSKPPKEDSNSVWIWAIVGGAAVVGAGIGGYVIYKNATAPVTGTATLTFQ